MRITKVAYDDKILEMQIEDEDPSVADMIHHELLKDNEVDFAGAILTHPLLKKVTIKIQTKGIEPKEALGDSLRRVAENILSILNETRKTVKEKSDN